jgi:hypothetical protein
MKSKEARQTHPDALGSFKALALIGFVALAFAQQPSLPSRGLDASWSQALIYAFLHGQHFGEDVTFTSGPLSFLWDQAFHPDTYYFTWAFDILLIGLVSTAVVRSGSVNSALLFLLVIVFAFPPIGVGDGIVYVAITAVFLLMLEGRPHILVMGCAFFALLVVTKFSFAIAALPLVLLLDLHRWCETPKQLPLALLAAAFSTIVFGLSGTPISTFPSFLFTSYQLTVGFPDAMQSSGPIYAPVLFFLCAASLLAWRATLVIGDLKRGSTPRTRRDATILVGLAWVLFVVWKGSFTRLDVHALTGLFGLPFLAYFLVGRSGLRSPRLSSSLLLAVALASAAAGHVIIKNYSTPSTPLAGLERIRNVKYLINPLKTHGLFSALWHERMQKLSTPELAGLRGTVAVVPWELASLVASAGAEVRFQPVLQTYCAYTRDLQDRTLTFYRNGPENLFIDLTAIDNQPPSLLFGRSLVEIITRYDLVRQSEFGLQSLRRPNPRDVERWGAVRMEARLGDWILIPKQEGNYTVAAIGVHNRLLSRVLSFFWSSYPLLLDLQLEGGQVVTHRFVNAAGAAGFVISPYLSTARDLIEPLSTGSSYAPRVLSFRLRSFSETDHQAYDVTFEALTISGSSERLADASVNLIRQIDRNMQQARSLQLRWLDAKTIFAHPPSEIRIEVPPRSALSGKIGIIDRAWLEGKTRGVHFEIVDDGQVVFNRELRPTDNADDRGDQIFKVNNNRDLPAVVLLRTGVLGDSAWGWSYWRDLVLELQ